MNRQFISAISLQLAAALSWFLYSAFIARILEPSDFGAVIYGFTAILMLGNITASGWSQALLRRGSRFWSADNIASLRFLIRQGLVSWASLSVVIGLALVLGWWLQLPHVIFEELEVIVLLSMGLSAYALLLLAASAMRAMGMLLKSLSFRGVLRSLLPLLVSVSLLFFVTHSLVSVLSIFVISLWCLSCIALIFLPRPLKDGAMTVAIAEKEENKIVARGLFGANFGRIVMENMDILVIGFVLNPIEIGLYMVAHRISAIISVIYDPARVISSPKISVAYTAPDSAELKKAASQAHSLFLFGGVGMCLGVYLFAMPLIDLFGDSFHEAYPILVLRILAQLSFALSGPTGVFMTMTKFSNERAIVVWSSAIFTGVATGLGGATYGLLGVSLCYAAAVVLTNFASACWVWKLLGIKPAVLDRGAYSVVRSRLNS